MTINRLVVAFFSIQDLHEHDKVWLINGSKHEIGLKGPSQPNITELIPFRYHWAWLCVCTRKK
jgi:hypothetical protein